MPKVLDDTIVALKDKGDNHGFIFYDLKIIICLEIIRLELSIAEKLSDLSIKAISEITSMDAHHYYKNSFPEIFNYLSLIMVEFTKSDSRFIVDPPGIIGFSSAKWSDYFKSAIPSLFFELENRK